MKNWNATVDRHKIEWCNHIFWSATKLAWKFSLIQLFTWKDVRLPYMLAQFLHPSTLGAHPFCPCDFWNVLVRNEASFAHLFLFAGFSWVKTLKENIPNQESCKYYFHVSWLKGLLPILLWVCTWSRRNCMYLPFALATDTKLPADSQLIQNQINRINSQRKGIRWTWYAEAV